MKDCTGEIIFACGRRYTEVSQGNIDQVSVGGRLKVWDNENFHNYPKPDNGEHSCLGCPCKRRAKYKKDMFYAEKDIDPVTNKAINRPTGSVISCAIADLKDSKKK